MFENIRIDAAEKKALLFAIKDLEDEVYLSGSRVDLNEKGGDIDILIFSKQNSLNLSLQVSRRFFMQCEEKIDVLVFDKDKLTGEQAAFINTLKLIRIK